MRVVLDTSIADEERWHREIVDPTLRDVHQVTAARGRGGTDPWRVSIFVTQLFHETSFEEDLRGRVEAALLAVAGVTEVEDTDVSWLVDGKALGSALVESVASVVDELAGEIRMELAQSVPDEDVNRFVAGIAGLPNRDAVYLDGIGWFQVLRFDEYNGKNPRTNERIHVPAKVVLEFQADENLVNTLNGRESEDLGDPTHSNEAGVTIHRYEWSAQLASRMQAELIARGRLHIAGFGSLRIVERFVGYDDPPRRTLEKRVGWTMSEALRPRLIAV